MGLETLIDAADYLLTTMIPLRIIQTHRTKRSLGAVHCRCQHELRRLHPQFEYLFFSDYDCRRFIQKVHPEFLPLWEFYPLGVQRADFFRILSVYHLGGFYFDLDVYFHEPLDDLLTSSIVFPQEWQMPVELYPRRHREHLSSPEDLTQLGNYGFGAVAGHWFFRAILEEMIKRTGEVDMQNLSTEDVLFSTGPDLVNAVARVHRKQLQDELVVLVGERNPRLPVHNTGWKNPRWAQFGRYANHLMLGSWK